MLKNFFENLMNHLSGKPKSRTQPFIPEKKDLTLNLKNDFGPGWDFESYETSDMNLEELTYRHIRDFPNVLHLGSTTISLFATEEGKQVIQIWKDIPTFDADDRVSDSWHELFLFQGENPGEVDGVYATGGYRLAQLVSCKHMLHVPEEISRLSLTEEPLP